MSKLVHGIGVYRTGKYQSSDPSYKLWVSMIGRCTPGSIAQKKNTSYIGCSVHPDWIEFQTFAEWCHYQVGFDCEDYQLDKDILVTGNKVYGSATCRFVPSKINRLLTNNKRNKGLYPTGVSLDASGKYRAQIGIANRVKYIGVFASVDEASIAYECAKRTEIRSMANKYKYEIDGLVYAALMSL